MKACMDVDAAHPTNLPELTHRGANSRGNNAAGWRYPRPPAEAPGAPSLLPHTCPCMIWPWLVSGGPSLSHPPGVYVHMGAPAAASPG